MHGHWHGISVAGVQRVQFFTGEPGRTASHAWRTDNADDHYDGAERRVISSQEYLLRHVASHCRVVAGGNWLLDFALTPKENGGFRDAGNDYDCPDFTAGLRRQQQ
jgi:hypothetical protein